MILSITWAVLDFPRELNLRIRTELLRAITSAPRLYVMPQKQWHQVKRYLSFLPFHFLLNAFYIDGLRNSLARIKSFGWEWEVQWSPLGLKTSQTLILKRENREIWNNLSKPVLTEPIFEEAVISDSGIFDEQGSNSSWPTGRIWPTTCLCIGHELRMDLNLWW